MKQILTKKSIYLISLFTALSFAIGVAHANEFKVCFNSSDPVIRTDEDGNPITQPENAVSLPSSEEPVFWWDYYSETNEINTILGVPKGSTKAGDKISTMKGELTLRQGKGTTLWEWSLEPNKDEAGTWKVITKKASKSCQKIIKCIPIFTDGQFKSIA